tara:strand:- start:1014 stop:2300 length:1287 start_codon:yes stop_codon:yes gene_type:complete
MLLQSTKNKPIIFFLLTMAAYFFLLLISPLTVNVERSPVAILIFFTSLLIIPPSIILGSRIISYLPKKQVNKKSVLIRSYGDRVSFAVISLNFWGGIGLLFVSIDRFIIRGMPLGLELFSARDILETTDTSSFGLIGQILSALTIFSAGYLLIERRVKSVSYFKILITYSLAIVYLLLSIMLGSRSGLLNFILIVVFMILFDRYVNDPKYKMPFILFAKIFFLGITFILSMATIFLWRLGEMEVDVSMSIFNSGYAYTVTPSENILDLTSSGIFGDLFLAIISLIQYAIHGFYEFQLLVENFNGDHTYGQQLLWFPLKVYNVLGGSFSITDLNYVRGVRNGIFSSFFGPIFIDFGIFTPLATACIFFILSIPFGLMSTKKIWTISYASLICCLIICLPVWNSIMSAAWIYPFISVFMIPFLTLRFKLK